MLQKQREWIQQRLHEEEPAVPQSLTPWQALRSRTMLLLVSSTFLNYLVIYTFAFWFPTMLKRQSALSDGRVGLLGAIPYIVTFLAMQINGWHSDKANERRWHSALPLLVAAAALLCLLSKPQSLALSLVLFTLVATAYSYLPAFWAVPSELLSKTAAATAVGLINAVGNIAGFAGPYLFGYLGTRTGSLSSGLTLMMLAAFFGGLLTLRIPRAHVR